MRCLTLVHLAAVVAVTTSSQHLRGQSPAGQSQVGDQVSIEGIDPQKEMQRMQQMAMKVMQVRSKGPMAVAFLSARLKVFGGIASGAMQARFRGNAKSIPFPESERHGRDPRKLEDALLVPVRSVNHAKFQPRRHAKALQKALTILDQAKAGNDKRAAEFRGHVNALLGVLNDRPKAHARVLAYRSWLMKGLLRPASAADLAGTALPATGSSAAAAAKTTKPQSPAGKKPASTAAAASAAKPAPAGYRPIVAPGFEATWDESLFARQQLHSWAQFYLRELKDPVRGAQLQMLAMYRDHLADLPKQSVAYEANLTEARQKLEDAIDFDQQQQADYFRKHVAKLQQQFDDLKTVQPLIEKLSKYGPSLGVALAAVNMQSDAELSKRINKARDEFVAHYRDQNLSPDTQQAARTVAKKLATTSRLLRDGNRSDAQRELDAMWNAALDVANHLPLDLRQSAQIALPSNDAEIRAMQQRAAQAGQKARAYDGQKSPVAAMRWRVRSSWLQLLASQAQRIRGAKIAVEQSKDPNRRPRNLPPKQIAEQIQRAEREFAKVSNTCRAALAMAWRRGSVFAADPGHGQSPMGLITQLEREAITLTNNAQRAGSASAQDEARKLAAECRRIASLIAASKFDEAQAGLDAEWQRILGESAPAPTAAETITISDAWVAMAQTGSVDAFHPGVYQKFETFRRFVNGCKQARDPKTGRVPLGAARQAIGPRNGLGFFLAFAGDDRLVREVGRARQAITASVVPMRGQPERPADRAAMQPFLDALTEVEALLQQGKTDDAQTLMNARWQDVLAVTDYIYVPNRDRIGIANERWLSRDYANRVRQFSRQLARSQGSSAEVARYAAKADYLFRFQQCQQRFDSARKQLAELQAERQRQRTLGRPVDARLENKIALAQKQVELGVTLDPKRLERGLSSSPGKGGKNATGLVSTGRWFGTSSRNPLVARELRQRIVKIEDALHPPGGKQRYSASDQAELRIAMASFRELLDLIERRDYAKAQTIMDRMDRDILAVEPR